MAMGAGSWKKTFTLCSQDTGTLQPYILIHTNWDSVCVCICTSVVWMCVCCSVIYREPLLVGQCRHWSMQILHHLSLHIGYICCSYCLAPFPVSCDIVPLLLIASQSLFSLYLSTPPSIPPIFNFHFSSPEMKILLQIPCKKERKDIFVDQK